MGAEGIRVNSVHPGLVNTFMTSGDDEFVAAAVAEIPLGRIAEPIEIANTVLFLLSDEASFVTGVQFPVDGGYRARSSDGPEGWSCGDAAAQSHRWREFQAPSGNWSDRGRTPDGRRDLEPLPKSDARDVEQAMRAARSAQVAWAQLSPFSRAMSCGCSQCICATSPHPSRATICRGGG
jgi:hypothetical protein